MAAVSGKTGKVNGALCAHAWTVNLNTDRLDVTSFCSNGYREFIEGLKGATGTISSYVRILSPDGVKAVTLYNPNITITGNAYLNETASTMVEDKVSFEYDLQFTGTVSVS
jgi:hypothetical protein